MEGLRPNLQQLHHRGIEADGDRRRGLQDEHRAAGGAAVDPGRWLLPFLLAVTLFLWTPSHFWSLAILLLWGVTGVYFAFPDPFVAVIDRLQPPAITPEPRSGDEFMAWMVRMHFGRYGGLGVRITYVIIGLLPAVLFVTGAIMWWNRALRRWVADLRSARTTLPHPATE